MSDVKLAEYGASAYFRDFPLSSAVFEGSEFPVPRMTDKYLTTMYGEWKKIPEPENRHTHLPLLLDFGDGEVWTAQN